MSSQVRSLTRNFAEVEAAALELTNADRAQLAARLLSSLDEDAAVERTWEEEIGHRMDDLAAGRMKTRPVEELIAILEGLVR